MKEKIIKISNPIPKVQVQPSEPELQSDLTQPQEISLPEELLEPEPIDIAEPASMRLARTNSNGWKVSDILREIRMDNFETGDAD